MLRSVLCAAVAALFSCGVLAKAPFGLSVEQAMNWTPEASYSDKKNISRVPLAERFKARSSQLSESLNPDVKVLIAPDGMDNFASYIDEQEVFNLYNFTHWAQIDVLNWFAGTADQNINIPSRPWVEAAHKNGVKVIGSIYLAVAQWGGSADTAEKFLRRDELGRFPMAHKLVEIAEFYGFDGWLMNQETDLSAVKDKDNELVKGVKDYNRAAFLGKEMLAFMTYLNHLAPENMEIHWYDAQLMDGTVRWQNELNQHNAPFFGHKFAPVSDAIFLNYWWDKKMVQDSHEFANRLRRDPYEVYTGVDLWPARNAQKAFIENTWLGDIFSDEDQQGLTSIALFGNNFNFNFTGNQEQEAYSDYQSNPQDYPRFYATETRLFAGDNLNMADHDKQKWMGLSRYIPARSVLTSLPFRTSFNTGHGMKKAQKGKVVSERSWHDVSLQDILPSWQFAVIGSKGLSLSFDFQQPYSGGSSLLVKGSTSDQGAIIPLYKTQFKLDGQTLKLASLGAAAFKVILTFSDNTQHILSIESVVDGREHGWKQSQFSLASNNGKVVDRISLYLDKGNEAVELRLGELAIE